MDTLVQPPDDSIRKIEDIIDIQKANGNFSIRQVAFRLPGRGGTGASAGAEAGAGAGVARSVESGLTRARSRTPRAKCKKQRSKRHKSPLPDVVSWPSDSDITVLRMKLCLAGAGGGGAEGAEGAGGEERAGAGGAAPGDGLHHPHSSSMVNLATLVLQSRSPSKLSLAPEECLLPLSSWGLPPPACPAPPGLANPPHLDVGLRDSGLLSRNDRKSKVAKFLRLYFCPCCTCLYEMEKMRDDSSSRPRSDDRY